MDSGNLETLVYFIEERERVREKKDRGEPPPWTTDPLISGSRFCNVRREDDRVTRWLKENWRDPFFAHVNLPVAMTVARLVNWPPTLKVLGFPEVWKPEEYIYKLEVLAQSGAKVWSSAYIVSTNGNKTPKARYVIGHIANNVYRYQGAITKSVTLEGTYNILRMADGIGSFLAGQIIADLKNTKGTLQSKAPDFAAWCSAGPGSRKGLSYVLIGSPERTFSEPAFDMTIRQVKDAADRRSELVRSLHMQDFQNCLCEFSKYMRLRGGGRARNGYVPGQAPSF